jgi:hypothetical protein
VGRGVEGSAGVEFVVYEEAFVSRGFMSMEDEGRSEGVAIREVLFAWVYVADGRNFYRFTMNVAPMPSSRRWKTGKTA